MNILVTGANGQLGNEIRIVSKTSSDNYLFTDVSEQEGNTTTFLDITDLDAIRQIVKENNIEAIEERSQQASFRFPHDETYVLSTYH